jgi:predicted lipoprotein with Yx(FWY)xxD motif
MRTLGHRHDEETGPKRRGAVMRASLLLALAAFGAIGFLAAGAVAQSGAGSNATVSLRNTKLGAVLVNSKHHTLYLFLKDKRGKSTCSGKCAKFWPPLLARGKPTGGPGVRASLLGTTKRGNGSLQVTYRRHPLYTFALDKRAGQTKGEGISGFGARWYAVSARGKAVRTAMSTTTTPTTTTPTTPTYPYP